MNINKLDSFITFESELSRVLTYQTLEEASVSELDIQRFISNNLSTIISQKNSYQLQIKLGKLANRLQREFPTPSAKQLAHEIKILADKVFKFTIADLPPELIKKVIVEALKNGILFCISEDSPCVLTNPTDTLKNIKLTSKQFSTSHQDAKREWIAADGGSLKVFGCKTAEQAVDYAIAHKLTGINLTDFIDLDDIQLQRLIKQCPNLKLLMIKSEKITQASAEYIGQLSDLAVFYLESAKITLLELVKNSNLREIWVKTSQLQKITFAKEPKALQNVILECGNIKELILPEKANALQRLTLFALGRHLQYLILPKEAISLNHLQCNGSINHIVWPDNIDALEDLYIDLDRVTHLSLPKVANALKMCEIAGGDSLTKVTMPEQSESLESVICANLHNLSCIVMARKTPVLRVVLFQECSQEVRLTYHVSLLLKRGAMADEVDELHSKKRR